MPDESKPITGKARRDRAWARAHAGTCLGCGRACSRTSPRCRPCSNVHMKAEKARKAQERRDGVVRLTEAFKPSGKHEDLAAEIALLADPARARYIDAVVARLRGGAVADAT